MKKHMETIEQFNLPYVIAINAFPTDTDREKETLVDWCEDEGAVVSLVNVFQEGAEAVLTWQKKL